MVRDCSSSGQTVRAAVAARAVFLGRRPKRSGGSGPWRRGSLEPACCALTRSGTTEISEFESASDFKSSACASAQAAFARGAIGATASAHGESSLHSSLLGRFWFPCYPWRHVRQSRKARDPGIRKPRFANLAKRFAYGLAAPWENSPAMDVRRLLTGLRRFGRAPPAKRLLATEAVLALLLARLLSWFLPVRWWLRFCHAKTEGIQEAEPGRRGDCGPGLPRRIGCIVAKVVRHLPFPMRCLPQAMAAHWMLRRRDIGSTLVFGARRSTDTTHRFEYHVWLTVRGERVVGGGEVESYTAFPPFAATGTDR